MALNVQQGVGVAGERDEECMGRRLEWEMKEDGERSAVRWVKGRERKKFGEVLHGRVERIGMPSAPMKVLKGRKA